MPKEKIKECNGLYEKRQENNRVLV